MPDVPGALKQIPADVLQSVADTAVGVADGVGEAIESAIVGPTPPPKPLDPKVQAQKKEDEQKRLQQAWGVIHKNQQQLQTDLSKIYAEKDQRKVQEQKDDEAKKDQKKIEMTQRSNLKQQQLAAKSTAENKGKGMGG